MPTFIFISIILTSIAHEVLASRLKARASQLANRSDSNLSTLSTLEDAKNDLIRASGMSNEEVSETNAVRDVFNFHNEVVPTTVEAAYRLLFKRRHCPLRIGLRSLLNCPNPRRPDDGASGALTVFSCDNRYLIKELLPHEAQVTDAALDQERSVKAPSGSFLMPICFWVVVGIHRESQELSNQSQQNKWIIMPNLAVHRAGGEQAALQASDLVGSDQLQPQGSVLGVFDLKGYGATPTRLSWLQYLSPGGEYKFESEIQGLILSRTLTHGRSAMLDKDLRKLISLDITDYSLLVVASEPRQRIFPRVQIFKKEKVGIEIGIGPEVDPEADQYDPQIMGRLPPGTVLEVVRSRYVYRKDVSGGIEAIVRAQISFPGFSTDCGKKTPAPCGSRWGFGWITVDKKDVQEVSPHTVHVQSPSMHFISIFKKILNSNCSGDAPECESLDALQCIEEEDKKSSCSCACGIVLEFIQRPAVFKHLDVLNMLYQAFDDPPRRRPSMIFSQSPSELLSRVGALEVLPTDNPDWTIVLDVMTWGYPLCAKVSLDAHVPSIFGGMPEGPQWPIEADAEATVREERKRICIAMSIIDFTKTGAEMGGVTGTLQWVVLGSLSPYAIEYADHFRTSIFNGMINIHSGA